LLSRLLHYLHKTPTLGFAIGPAFSNFDYVTRASLVALIVNSEFCPAPDVLAVFRMLDLEVNGNLDTFVTTVAYYQAGQRFQFSILHLRF
jgi:hypothetical protein